MFEQVEAVFLVESEKREHADWDSFSNRSTHDPLGRRHNANERGTIAAR